MTDILQLEPRKVFQRFAQINAVPRGSGNEQAIGRLLVEIGRSMGLETLQDQAGNVVIRKPAAPGYEERPGVTLQGHMDMVCEKDEDSTHDFLRDGIDMIVDNGWICANKTTLGADDGIGVAMALALLEEEMPHPALDVLVTTSEETGMDGAIGLAPSFIRTPYLINIDSEEEGYLTVGCAGGSTGRIELDMEREAAPAPDRVVYQLRIDRMRGGHSGMEILEVRTSALKTMAEFLHMLDEEIAFSLTDFHSGTKHNAIPNAATAVISCSTAREAALLDAMERVKAVLIDKLFRAEPDVRFSWDRVTSERSALTESAKKKLISCLELLPHGVYSMMPQEKMVEASDNLASAHTEDAILRILMSLRSGNEEKLEELQRKIAHIVETFDGRCVFSEGYPAWEYREESALRELFCKKYREQAGRDPEILVIHAGLECGLFARTHPGVDMVSFGPDVHGAHTTKERLSIESVQRSYELLKSVVCALGEDE